MESSRIPRQPEHEKLKSFDLMASVDMMQFDIERLGYVLPETRQRVYDEELSGLAEGVGRAARTKFTFNRQDGDLVYFDSGKWLPYMGMLMTGLEVARAEKEVDARKTFLHDWATRDVQYGYRMDSMQPGQRMAWYNAYPKALEAPYGEKFLRDCGLFPDRQMGFLYLATCNEDGSVTLESQTVDRSDEEAFEKAMSIATYGEAYDMDSLLRTYDGVLSRRHGGKFYAGRRNSEIGENAWAEIARHGDLVAFFLDGLESLAASNLSRRELVLATNRHVIGVWKAFKNRLNEKTPRTEEWSLNYDNVTMHNRLELETQAAYQQARDEGDIKTACGGTLRADDDPDPVDGRGTFDSIFGKNSSEETYKFDKKMYCVVCQLPPEKGEPKKMCGPCGICRGCDAKLKAKSRGALALAA